MKESTVNLILAGIGVIIGFSMDNPISSTIAYTMAFMLLLTSSICSAIERSGNEKAKD